MDSFLELALFESDGTGAVRLVGRENDAALVRAVQTRILERRRAEVARLERGDNPPRLEAVPEDDPDPSAA